jgi:signal transduction histidine kinase/ligand-binding sensor domain-containing protein/DNA-binding response OmpR family regulator
MLFRNLTACLLGLALLAGPLFSQPQANLPGFDYLTIETGLIQNEVTALLQDRYGFIWIGTRGGLVRYDGYEYHEIGAGDTTRYQLPNHSIESLHEDAAGYIWIGTKSGGLSRYDPATGSLHTYPVVPGDSTALAGDRIISLASSPDSQLWVGSWDQGLQLLHKATGRFRQVVPSGKVTSVIPDGQGGVWATLHARLAHFDAAGNRLEIVAPPYRVAEFTSLAYDAKRAQIWLGSWGAGLSCYDLKTGTWRQFLPEAGSAASLSSKNCYHLSLDPASDELWIGTWGAGLNRMQLANRQVERFQLAPPGKGNRSINYNIVLSFLKDRTGLRWIGTDGGGICRQDPRQAQFDLLLPSAQLPEIDNDVLCVLEDPRQRLWVGTKGSGLLLREQDGQWHQIDLPGLGRQPIKTLYQRQDGQIWVGTGTGLFIFSARYQLGDPPLSAYTPLSGPHPLAGSKIISIRETANGSLWIGTQQRGLYRIDQPNQARLKVDSVYRGGNQPGSLHSNRISYLYEDRQNRLWVGTYKGLHLYQPSSGRFVAYLAKLGSEQAISSNIINYIQEDRQGRLWVGTSNGLNRMEATVDGQVWFRKFRQQEGLPNDYLHAMLPDQRGHLWLSTNKGVARFDTETFDVTAFGPQDGLQAYAFSEGAAFLNSRGEMYLGGIYGLNHFHPDSIGLQEFRAPIVLTGISVNQTRLGPEGTIGERQVLSGSLAEQPVLALRHDENDLGLRFAALNFRTQGQHRYRYKLEPMEQDWTFAGTRPQATYTNLPPGTYRLRIQAANHHGLWSDQEATLSLAISNPPWKTWWAFLGYALGLGGLLSFFRWLTISQYKLKTRLKESLFRQEKQRELNQLKTQFFTNVAHELRTPLTLILGPLEDLLQGKNQQQGEVQHLQRMHRHTRKLLSLVNQLMDFHKAEHHKLELMASEGDVVALVNRVCMGFENEAERRQLDFQFCPAVPFAAAWFESTKLEAVLTNLLSNAFKHTQKGDRIEVVVVRQLSAQNENQIEIVVKDTGEGMPPAYLENIFDRYFQVTHSHDGHQAGTGIGLALTHDFVKLHGGHIEVESTLGQGSIFRVILPVGHAHLRPDQIDPNPGQPQVKKVALGEANPALPAESLATAAPILTQEGPEEEPPTVLVVEDNVEVREFIVTLLEATYRVRAAENGVAGLAAALDLMPDLIISDVMMPMMDGMEMCQELKQRAETSHIPILMLTAHTDVELQIQGIALGADVYLSKPFRPELLLAHLRNFINQREQMRAYYSDRLLLQPSNVEVPSSSREFLESLISYVEAHMDEPDFSVESLTEVAAMSYSSLYRKLKAITGQSVSTFVRDIRLQRCGQLMQTGEFNVSEAAYQVGFNDIKHFRKCFKDHFGVMPSAYLKEHAPKS